jgi:hypothetical protein
MGKLTSKPQVLIVSALTLVAILTLVWVFFHPCAPAGAIAVASRFIEDVQDGRIGDAYQLTDKGADVGKNVRVFAANEDVVALLASRKPILLEYIRPMMSRAQRMSRLIRGARVEPEFLYASYFVGLPFLVRLRYSQGEWLVSYFEFHDE